MQKIQEIKIKLNKKQGQLQQLESQLEKQETLLNEQINKLKIIEQAQEVIQVVAKLTQEQIKLHITDIVNLALSSIPFPEQYEFGMDFVIKRNKTECELFLLKDGNKLKPVDSTGGGILDVISFGLRIALWSLKSGKKNNTIVLDEPLKFISKDLRPYASDMIKKISEKLELQFLIVTHDEEFIEMADKTFKVKINNGVSKVKKVL